MDNKYKIGDKVKIKASVYFNYNENDYRSAYRNEFNEPKEVFIIGGTYRIEGIYHKICFYDSIDGAETEPAYLEIKNKRFVYQYRENFTRKIKDVLPEDII